MTNFGLLNKIEPKHDKSAMSCRLTVEVEQALKLPPRFKNQYNIFNSH